MNYFIYLFLLIFFIFYSFLFSVWIIVCFICCVFKVTQCFQTPFWAVYLSSAGIEKVGNLKSNLNEICLFIWGEHFENLTKICLKFKHTLTRLTICQEGWCAVLPEQLFLGEVHLLRDRPSLKTKLISNRAPILPRTEPCPWKVMTNSLTWVARRRGLAGVPLLLSWNIVLELLRILFGRELGNFIYSRLGPLKWQKYIPRKTLRGKLPVRWEGLTLKCAFDFFGPKTKYLHGSFIPPPCTQTGLRPNLSLASN